MKRVYKNVYGSFRVNSKLVYGILKRSLLSIGTYLITLEKLQIFLEVSKNVIFYVSHGTFMASAMKNNDFGSHTT